jgi:hypothetical protein
LSKKINVKDVEAALAVGDDLSELTGDDGKRIRKTVKDTEDEPKSREKRKPRGKIPEPEPILPLPVEKNTSEEVPEMVAQSKKNALDKAKVVKPANQKQTRPQPSPFGQALYAARLITTRRPEEEQPEEYKKLCDAMDDLDDRGRRNLVFQLQKKVMEDKCQKAGLFAAARRARMLAVAVSTVTVQRTGLTFSGLQEVGLVFIDKDKDGHPRTNYRFGKANLVEAAKKLRRQGNINAAQTLEAYLSRNEREKALREAAKEADTETDAGEETSKS